MSYTKTMYKEQILEPVINITQRSLEDNDFSPILDKINIVLDMLEGISSTNSKVGEIWNELSSDVISSIYSATSGFYRQAILSLRSVLELGCSSFFYLDHKVEHEMFIQFNTKADKYVSSLVRDYAFFTSQYISAFYGEISQIENGRDSISTGLGTLLLAPPKTLINQGIRGFFPLKNIHIYYSLSGHKSDFVV